MKITAYMNISWIGKIVHTLPGDKEDTLGRLQEIQRKCSKIPSLVEMHVVFGPMGTIAKAKVDTMKELTKVINEIEKVLPIRSLLTFIVQPQLRPSQTPEDVDLPLEFA